MYQSIKIWKGVESQSISAGVKAREEACGNPPPPENGVIRTGKKFYMPPLPSTCNEI